MSEMCQSSSAVGDNGEERRKVEVDASEVSNQTAPSGINWRAVGSRHSPPNADPRAKLGRLEALLNSMNLPDFTLPVSSRNQPSQARGPPPDGWEEGIDPDTESRYLDDTTLRRTEFDPRIVTTEEKEGLPEGWDIRINEQQKYFVNHNTRTTTWINPRITKPEDDNGGVSEIGRGGP
ncbi:hypothetical protein L218DRAFT_945380 [Marasmius fiardii PR-910]|nr:hypothetical protein L218DRAFT_945380 [Marasmius fiardii PR-910]